MRWSEPMPRRTISTSAPSRSREAGDLVHEADLGREHAVGGVFGQFRRAHVHHDDLVVVPVEGRVDLAQHFLGLGVGGADDDALGVLRVRDCRPFLEELGVRDHIEVEIAPAVLLDGAAHEVARAHRHGALVEDDGEWSRCSAISLATTSTNDRSVSPDPVGRRADGDEDRPTRRLAPQVGGERDAVFPRIALHHLLEARLVDRHHTGLQAFDLGGVHVDAQDVMSDLGQNRPLDEPDIAGSEHGDLHGVPFVSPPGPDARRRISGSRHLGVPRPRSAGFVAAVPGTGQPGGSRYLTRDVASPRGETRRRRASSSAPIYHNE